MGKFYSRRDFLIHCLSGGVGLFVLQKSFTPGLPGLLGANDRFRVGVVGLGRMGLKHIQNFAGIRNVAVCAICDPDEERLLSARSIVQKLGHNTPLATTDYRRIADIKDLDAVSIAVPRNRRVEMALDFCSAEKDILLERPFSLTAREGKVLVDAADRSGRLIQQRDDGFVFSQDDVSSEALVQLGPIDYARGWKGIFADQSELNSRFTNDHPRQTLMHEDLIEGSWCDLDMARSILDGDVPHSLSTKRIGQLNNLNQRILVEVEYRVKGRRSRMEFELRSQGLFKGHSNPNPGSFHQFFGKHGNLKISAKPEQEQWADRISFTNFIDCVRDRTPGQLLNHIKEARKSNLLIELTKYSLGKEGSVEVDSATEAIIGAYT